MHLMDTRDRVLDSTSAKCMEISRMHSSHIGALNGRLRFRGRLRNHYTLVVFVAFIDILIVIDKTVESDGLNLLH